MPPDFLVVFAAMALPDSFCLSLNTDLSSVSANLGKQKVREMNKAKTQKGKNEATESLGIFHWKGGCRLLHQPMISPLLASTGALNVACGSSGSDGSKYN